MKSGSQTSETQIAKLPRKFTEQSMPIAQAAPKEPQSKEVSAANTAAAVVPDVQNLAAIRKTETRMPEQARELKPQIEVAVDAYRCGAQTAKGTPCKHRVKGSVRCFQHTGMPAMLPPDKLKIN
ncbi:MAG: hypothetical protein ACKVRN_01545 [Pyrinomonadaceae bacterium]